MTDKTIPGDMLPLMTLPALSGGEVSLAAFKGERNLILYFFDVDCMPCVAFLERLAEVLPELREQNTEVVAVGSESVDELARRFTDLKLPFPLLSDFDGTAWQLYNAGALTVIVADKFGEIRQRIDTDGGILPDVRVLLDAVSLIELECPECGISTWRM